VTGVSMLLSDISGWPLSTLLLVINLPFIAIGYRQIGRKFAVKSTLGIVGLSLCLLLVNFPDVTPDKLLTAVFGGLFIGAGIGLAMRGGSVLDGTEIAALLVSRNSHLLRVGDVILLLNIAIFLTAAFFLGVESAMYSILTYFAATKAIDFLLHGFEQYTAINIISEKGEEIREAIVDKLNRGVTVFKGSGGFFVLAQLLGKAFPSAGILAFHGQQNALGHQIQRVAQVKARDAAAGALEVPVDPARKDEGRAVQAVLDTTGHDAHHAFVEGFVEQRQRGRWLGLFVKTALPGRQCAFGLFAHAGFHLAPFAVDGVQLRGQLGGAGGVVGAQAFDAQRHVRQAPGGMKPP